MKKLSKSLASLSGSIYKIPFSKQHKFVGLLNSPFQSDLLNFICQKLHLLSEVWWILFLGVFVISSKRGNELRSFVHEWP